MTSSFLFICPLFNRYSVGWRNIILRISHLQCKAAVGHRKEYYQAEQNSSGCKANMGSCKVK